jgi:hypothetical protein
LHAHHGQIAYALGLENPIILYIRHNGIFANSEHKEKIINNPTVKFLNIPVFFDII